MINKTFFYKATPLFYINVFSELPLIWSGQSNLIIKCYKFTLKFIAEFELLW